MRVLGVDIHATNSDRVINFSFRDPDTQKPYVVKNILGLDADEIVTKFYGTSTVTNDKFYEMSLLKRNIIVHIGLNPTFAIDQTYSVLRDEIYKLVASSRTGAIQLRFKDEDKTVAAISGFVTKVEASHFTRSPELQLTVNCSDPTLKAFEQVSIDVTDLNPTSTAIIDDESTAPHGFRFGVLFTGTTETFAVQDSLLPTWAFAVDLTGSPLGYFQSTDELHFSSEHNNRYLYLTRGFETVHLVDRIVPGSVWPIMFPGDNLFVCSEFVDWDYITHYPTYWGV